MLIAGEPLGFPGFLYFLFLAMQSGTNHALHDKPKQVMT